MLHRRIIAALLLVWAPLLILSIAEGTPGAATVKLAVSSRRGDATCAAAWPLPCDRGGTGRPTSELRRVVQQFVERNLIPDVGAGEVLTRPSPQPSACAIDHGRCC